MWACNAGDVVVDLWLANGVLIIFPMTIYFYWKLNRLFDAEVLEQKIFHRHEKLLPFYGIRRTGVYALWVAAQGIVPAKYVPNYDFRGKASKRVVVACRIYAILLILTAVAVYVLGVPYLFFCRG